jgi:hypothetical protein
LQLGGTQERYVIVMSAVRVLTLLL